MYMGTRLSHAPYPQVLNTIDNKIIYIRNVASSFTRFTATSFTAQRQKIAISYVESIPKKQWSVSWTNRLLDLKCIPTLAVAMPTFHYAAHLPCRVRVTYSVRSFVRPSVCFVRNTHTHYKLYNRIGMRSCSRLNVCIVCTNVCTAWT